MKKQISKVLLLTVVFMLSSCAENIQSVAGEASQAVATETQPAITEVALNSSAAEYEKIEINGGKIVDVASGDNYIIILSNNGEVFAEGKNETGALASGDFGSTDKMVKIDLPEKIKLVDDCVAVGESNTVYFWGVSYYEGETTAECDIRPSNLCLPVPPKFISLISERR